MSIESWYATLATTQRSVVHAMIADFQPTISKTSGAIDQR
jgi:hypothetical protein